MWKTMSNGFLSQEEIDSLLNGSINLHDEEPEVEALSDIEKDLLGEIGNICMGSASTALSTIIGQQVNITTPVVSMTTLKKLKDDFEVPNIALEVKYTSGIMGENLLVMKITDAAVIASLMMGGDGSVEGVNTLSEIEVSAVSEAMNQMIGSAATSMATMFSREINISPPLSKIWTDITSPLSEEISDEQQIVKISFKLTIGTIVDSYIMQVLPIETTKKIVAIMMGQENIEPSKASTSTSKASDYTNVDQNRQFDNVEANNNYYENFSEKPADLNTRKVDVRQAAFPPLTSSAAPSMPKNIDLILDVPLEISVVLGRTKKCVKDILSLGTGSLVELDKLAEEPVEILVNGKKVAYGEVVVVDENFGVRITSIVSGAERIKTLGK
jgi:flagellar motor switch protein FliN